MDANKELAYYLKVFGTPEGQRVLKDLMDFEHFMSIEPDETDIIIGKGRRDIINFIIDRLKAACGKNRKPYADIIYEVSML